MGSFSRTMPLPNNRLPVGVAVSTRKVAPICELCVLSLAYVGSTAGNIHAVNKCLPVWFDTSTTSPRVVTRACHCVNLRVLLGTRQESAGAEKASR